MIRVMRPRSGDRDIRRPTNSTAFTRRSLGLSTASLFFSRRSESGHLDPSQAILTSPTPHLSPSNRQAFDTLALVRRLPTKVSAPCHVKAARHLSVFSRFERYWLELRGRLVVMLLHDNVWTSSKNSNNQSRNQPNAHNINMSNSDTSTSTSQSPSSNYHPPPKDAVIVSVFSVERCLVLRPRSKAPILKVSNPSHPYHIWLKFDNDHDCATWEKALTAAASQRVVGISDFEFISPIGKGASGKVFLVSDRNTGEKLALKVISKDKVFKDKTAFRHALDERLALEMVDGHPFFSRLRYAFQTKAFFYLVIDFYDGGDLYQYLHTHHGKLKEYQVRAVSSQVLIALEYFHSLKFVYRDLKPENVLLDSKGNIRLADFGLCKLMNDDKSLTNSVCGTHTYAAPEMLVRNYGKSIDLWAFGIFVYNILRGRTPYEAQNIDEVIVNMNQRRIRFSSNTSQELVAMIKKLLDYNPNTRLGCGIGGMLEVRGHSFYKGVDWKRVYLKDEELPGLLTPITKRNSTTIEPTTSLRSGENSSVYDANNLTATNENNQQRNTNASVNTGTNLSFSARNKVRPSDTDRSRNSRDLKDFGTGQKIASGLRSSISTSTRLKSDNLTEDAAISTAIPESNEQSLSSTVPPSAAAAQSSQHAGNPSAERQLTVRELADRMNAMGMNEMEGNSVNVDERMTKKVGGEANKQEQEQVDDNEDEDEDEDKRWMKRMESGREPNSSPENDDIQRKGRRIYGETLKDSTTTGTSNEQQIQQLQPASGSTSAMNHGKTNSMSRYSRDVPWASPLTTASSAADREMGDRGRPPSSRRRESAATVERKNTNRSSGFSTTIGGAGAGVVGDINDSHVKSNLSSVTTATGTFERASQQAETGRGKESSLREQMAAAAEQDELRNFDMSEWGKISVDNDHDDGSYGDGALWPFARARRKLNEEERMVAGFGYCSTSTPMGLPDYL